MREKILGKEKLEEKLRKGYLKNRQLDAQLAQEWEQDLLKLTKL